MVIQRLNNSCRKMFYKIDDECLLLSLAVCTSPVAALLVCSYHLPNSLSLSGLNRRIKSYCGLKKMVATDNVPGNINLSLRFNYIFSYSLLVLHAPSYSACQERLGFETTLLTEKVNRFN